MKNKLSIYENSKTESDILSLNVHLQYDKNFK